MSEENETTARGAYSGRIVHGQACIWATTWARCQLGEVAAGGAGRRHAEVRVLLLHRGLSCADDGLRRHGQPEGERAPGCAGFLAAGLDPSVVRSSCRAKVPAHAELGLLLGMITPLSWLERVPSYKDSRSSSRRRTLGRWVSGLSALLMSADILVYQADFVPVGQDQAAACGDHAEMRAVQQFLFPGLPLRPKS